MNTKCWSCNGQRQPSSLDAQRAALCQECERKRIRKLMGLENKRAPLSKHLMVS